MKTLILLTLLFVNAFPSAGQPTKDKQQKIQKLKGDLNCVYKPKYSETQRNQFYPFNIADTIKLVSFRYHNHNYPIKKDTLIADSLIEIKSLTKDEVNVLTDILYNNFYKQNPNYGELTQCYFPRNAILFFDKSGKLKEYILICFHCNRHEESSDSVVFGSECTQKIEKLRQFFVSTGLKFGTDNNINIYEGESDEYDVVAPPINN
ncbi:hypothetical protein FRZ67_13280 [Panacibacter ginsenosidivorans]|uniref:Uncharacterized protein n=1 Tax=Panacibacter ginsenosidivorans TaxID=1813871 RepID=A0A5B8VB57_9BACT|nr:hypothetical protein [Panacibacter ginsenosidivorans]QEC68223.1 hypothetical protein FRZ67_13280 [Panacibacter ginsenosidivorans]